MKAKSAFIAPLTSALMIVLVLCLQAEASSFTQKARLAWFSLKHGQGSDDYALALKQARSFMKLNPDETVILKDGSILLPNAIGTSAKLLRRPGNPAPKVIFKLPNDDFGSRFIKRSYSRSVRVETEPTLDGMGEVEKIVFREMRASMSRKVEMNLDGRVKAIEIKTTPRSSDEMAERISVEVELQSNGNYAVRSMYSPNNKAGSDVQFRESFKTVEMKIPQGAKVYSHEFSNNGEMRLLYKQADGNIGEAVVGAVDMTDEAAAVVSRASRLKAVDQVK